MEYTRKNRFVTYHSYKCKEYLRNDFRYECAYCGIKEDYTGVILDNHFEIEHFIPQNPEVKINFEYNVHEYSNLFYSCKLCNSKKSNKWNEKLLNPCKDYIFNGDNPPISGGDSEKDNYKFFANSQEGQIYIDIFELNSREQVKTRKRIKQSNNNTQKIKQLIKELSDAVPSMEYNDDVINTINLLNSIHTDKMNKTRYNDDFQNVKNILDKNNLNSQILFNDYDMDFEIDFDGKKYYCELVIDDRAKFTNAEKNDILKFIDVTKLNTWFDEVQLNFGIIYYFKNINALIVYPITDNIKKQDIKNKSRHQIVLQRENLIQ